MQQYNVLNKQEQEKSDSGGICHKTINPRHDIVKALLQYVRKDIEKGYLVIVVGGLNECVMRSRFVEEMEEIRITNVIKVRLGNKDKWRTQNRGGRVIGGVWMIYTLVPYVNKMGAVPFSTLFDSDHRGIHVDLSLNISWIPLVLYLDRRSFGDYKYPYLKEQDCTRKRCKKMGSTKFGKEYRTVEQESYECVK